MPSNGITVTPLPIYLAAIDEKRSRLGYTVLVVHHWLLTLFAFGFNSAFDSFATIMLINTLMLVTVLAVQSNEMNGRLADAQMRHA